MESTMGTLTTCSRGYPRPLVRARARDLPAIAWTEALAFSQQRDADGAARRRRWGWDAILAVLTWPGWLVMTTTGVVFHDGGRAVVALQRQGRRGVPRIVVLLAAFIILLASAARVLLWLGSDAVILAIAEALRLVFPAFAIGAGAVIASLGLTVAVERSASRQSGIVRKPAATWTVSMLAKRPGGTTVGCVTCALVAVARDVGEPGETVGGVARTSKLAAYYALHGQAPIEPGSRQVRGTI